MKGVKLTQLDYAHFSLVNPGFQTARLSGEGWKTEEQEDSEEQPRRSSIQYQSTAIPGFGYSGALFDTHGDFYSGAIWFSPKQPVSHEQIERKMREKFRDAWIYHDDGRGYIIKENRRAMVCVGVNNGLGIMIGSCGAFPRKLGDLSAFWKEARELEKAANILLGAMLPEGFVPGDKVLDPYYLSF